MEIRLNTTELAEKSEMLKSGDRVLLSGEIFTSRDAAHKRLCDALRRSEPLPFSIKGACIYYAGPTPCAPGRIIGSCGPTTSGRMDIFTPLLLDAGLKAMIGKGERNDAVCKSIADNKAVYLCAVGGAGALAAKCIKACEETAYPELGCESIKKLTVEDFPLLVAIDCRGGNLFKNRGGSINI